MADYKADLNRRYWQYQESYFSPWQDYFERPYAPDGRPPVFIANQSWRNIIINPVASEPEIEKLLSFVPEGEKHKWFRSMNNSQALAQSILGNLALYNLLPHLSEIKDDGLGLLGKGHVSSHNFVMEHKINYLGEPRSTSLDAYFSGEYHIAIECKFTEAEIGTCSRPRLKPTASNFEREYCNGTYAVQRARKERCSLSDVGVLYWRYVPALFKWGNDSDFTVCPLNKNYQLVRNVLAVGVKPDGMVSVRNGHVVFIYDARNPAFQKGGNGLDAFIETQTALQEPAMLRKCSWQCIVQHMRETGVLPWLTEHLALKYGI